MIAPTKFDMPGVEAMSELIARSGVRAVFSMLGASHVVWIAHGVRKGNFSLVRTRHEATAVSAAAGFGRVSDEVAVCAVAPGPGFLNALNALTAAARNHQPLLIIVASTPRLLAGSQAVDQRALAEVIGVGFHEVHEGEQLESSICDSISAAHRTGSPQVLCVADHVLSGPVTVSTSRMGQPANENPDQVVVEAIAGELISADRPLLLAGQGAVLSGAADALARLAELTGARLGTTLMANHMFRGHPRSLGLCGSWAAPAAHAALRDTDFVVAVGTSLDPHTVGLPQFATSTVLARVDSDPSIRNGSPWPDLFLAADALAGVRAIDNAFRKRTSGPSKPKGTVMTPDATVSSVRCPAQHRSRDGRGLDTIEALTALDQMLPNNRIVVSDSGRHLPSLATLVSARDARSWLVSRGHGSIGLGLGAAIGAAVAEPKRPVVLICGDGGFMMASHDLDAIRLNNLRLTIVLLNDEQYGAEVDHLARHGLDHSIATQDLPDIPQLANAFGGRGVVIRTIAELYAHRFDHETLDLLDVRIDPAVSAMAPIDNQIPSGTPRQIAQPGAADAAGSGRTDRLPS